MKTMQAPKTCNPSRLHKEFVSAGVPVLTVRGKFANVGDGEKGCAMYAVVVAEDSADMAKVRETVEAHTETERPSRTPSDEERERSLIEMEKIL